jgi:hypothetical protein
MALVSSFHLSNHKISLDRLATMGKTAKIVWKLLNNGFDPGCLQIKTRLFSGFHVLHWIVSDEYWRE